MIQRCRTCRHWIEEDPQHPYESQRCVSRKIVCTQDRRVPDDDSAVVADYEDYASVFLPGPEFGCIHWGPNWRLSLAWL